MSESIRELKIDQTHFADSDPVKRVIVHTLQNCPLYRRWPLLRGDR